MEQLNLFKQLTEGDEIEKILLYALGEFQSRGKVLADRELALDRLRGALKRAATKFGVEELSDEIVAENMEKIGIKVVKVAKFIAKHPFRVTVSSDLAAKSHQVFNESRKMGLMLS